MCWSYSETRRESDGGEREEGGREGAKEIGCSEVEGAWPQLDATSQLSAS
jgi:hypothetical protein